MRPSYRFPNTLLAALMAAALLSPAAFADAPSPDAKPASTSGAKAGAKPRDAATSKDAATPKTSDGKAATKDSAGKAAAGTAKAPAGESGKTTAGASAKSGAKASPKKAKPAGPDDLTPPTTRHVVTCPNPKISPCVMRKPVLNGYRLLTSGIEIQDNGVDWIVDFGKGARPARLLFQVYEQGGGIHDIDVSFFTKAGMQKPPSAIE